MEFFWMDVTSAFRLSSLFLACAAFAGLALTVALGLKLFGLY